MCNYNESETAVVYECESSFKLYKRRYLPTYLIWISFLSLLYLCLFNTALLIIGERFFSILIFFLYIVIQKKNLCYLKGTNFRGQKFSRNKISRVCIFMSLHSVNVFYVVRGTIFCV